jgi:hypothetical protein
MKKLILTLALLLIASRTFAQTATLATPVVQPSYTSLIVGQVHESRNDPNDSTSASSIKVIIWMLDSTGARVNVITSTMTTSAEISGFLAAVETPLAGEIAGTTLTARARRHNARILNYIVTNCAGFVAPCTTQVSTAVVVP